MSIHNQKKFYYSSIFVTGGAILALELLASRIMTPYFGVSLFIWTGILSITLISLAIGYWWGGKLAQSSTNNLHRLAFLFSIMPALAAIAIILGCLIYPQQFYALARWDLVYGAFAACLILLLLPLVVTSAMNPLLVALVIRSHPHKNGDAGSGWVFFVSTIGSVAGVIVTAFILIPNLSNFTAVLMIAIALSTISLAIAAQKDLLTDQRPTILTTSILALFSAGLLAWYGDAYTQRQGPLSYNGNQWYVESMQSSLFGTVKVLRSTPEPSGKFERIFFHDGLTQNTVDSNQQSLSFYTYGLEALTRAYQPHAKNILLLGLGAGVVPMQLASMQANIAVVEINPSAIKVAQQYFNFDDQKVTVYQADARTYIHNCNTPQDVIIVDLFHGDGTPDYLITREFFADLRRCLSPQGVAVFNTFANLDLPRPYAHLLTTLLSELPYVDMYRPHWQGAVQINSFLVAGLKPLPKPQKITLNNIPVHHEKKLWDMLATPQPITANHIADGSIILDSWNPAAIDMAENQTAFRRNVLLNTPSTLLIN